MPRTLPPRRGPRKFNRFAMSMGLAAAIACAAMIIPAAAQVRVVNYNIAQLNGNLQNLQAVFTALHADDKPGFAVPVSIFVFQEVQNADFMSLLTMLNNTAPPGVDYAGATFSTSAFEDGSGGAQAMFYRFGMFSEVVAGHIDLSTGGNRNTDRWLLNLSGHPGVSLYVYGSHLKADDSGADEQERLAGVNAIRINADTLGASHIIYAGDMNFYDNLEPGYQRFIQPGNGQAFDPLGTGSWAGSSGSPNNIKHSQSPRNTVAGSPLVGGGMNDRFDFQLSSGEWHDGAGLSIIAGLPHVYRTFGNDGAHLNLAINNGSNFYYPSDLFRSNALATNLYHASDHIPVVVDYQRPAVMSADIDSDFGRVIQGANVAVPIDVFNDADVVVVQGADELTYAAVASGALSGAFNDIVLPLGDVSSPDFMLDTSIVGLAEGQVDLTSASQGVANPQITLESSGLVLRHANASFSGNEDVDVVNVPIAFEPDTGVQTIHVEVHNLGFDGLQATLDVESTSAVSPPLQFTGGLQNGVENLPATLSFAFDTTGLSPGRFTAPITVGTSDEDLPGETAANLQMTLTITVGEVEPCLADIAPAGSPDGLVNVDDLLAVINAWGACADPNACPADIAPAGPPVGDDQVNVDDLLAVINGWGSCR